MTLFFNKKKYKMDISDFSNKRELVLSKRRLFFFYTTVSKVLINVIPDKYNFDFPRPCGSSHREGQLWSTQIYSVNTFKNINDNMNQFMESLIDNAFEIDDINIDSYKSIVREDRLKKLLTNE